MNERRIRILPDKSTNRFAIHDADTDELLHLFQSNKELGKLTPTQLSEQEEEALRDFIVNGRHGTDEEEEGW